MPPTDLDYDQLMETIASAKKQKEDSKAFEAAFKNISKQLSNVVVEKNEQVD